MHIDMLMSFFYQQPKGQDPLGWLKARRCLDHSLLQQLVLEARLLLASFSSNKISTFWNKGSRRLSDFDVSIVQQLQMDVVLATFRAVEHERAGY